MQNSRLASIETFRIISVFAVVCIHAFPFRWVQGQEIAFYIINNACRFAVPFFFIVSGFFFGMKLNENIPVQSLLYRYLKRLLIIFGFWTFFL